MLRFFVYILEIIIMFVMQSSLFSYLRIGGVVPDCLLILIVSIAYTKGQNRAIICAFISGLMLDLMFAETIGITPLIYMFIGYMAGHANKYYKAQDFFMPAALIAGGELFFGIAYYSFGFLLMGKTAFGIYLLNTILPRVLYTLLVAIVLYPLLLVVHNLILRTEGGYNE